MIAVCAIIKDCPESYLKEWIDWHLLIGFDKIIIYNNGSEIPIEPSKNVDVIPFPGPLQQMPAYADCLEKYRDMEWIAFVDDDEFVYTKKDLRLFLNELPNDVDAILLNWVMFGPDSDSEPRSLIENMTKRMEANPGNHAKSIVRPANSKISWSPHHFTVKNKAVDIFGNLIPGPFVPNFTSENAFIAHYHYMGKEEVLRRFKRGKPNGTMVIVPENFNVWYNNLQSAFTVKDKVMLDRLIRYQQKC